MGEYLRDAYLTWETEREQIERRASERVRKDVRKARMLKIIERTALATYLACVATVGYIAVVYFPDILPFPIGHW